MSDKINILGTTYTILITDAEHEPRLSNCDGFCDKTSKKVVITLEPKDCNLDDWIVYKNKILRHEIIHAFFFESGLHENLENRAFGVPETIVDWFAVQFPKIKAVFELLGIEE